MLKKKILHLNSGFNSGGGTVAVTRITLKVLSGEFDNYVVSYDLTDSINTFSLNAWSDVSKIKGFFYYVFNLSNRKKFFNILKKVSPDVIHIQNLLSSYSPAILSALKKFKQNNDVRIIYTAHDYSSICPNSSCFNYKKNKFCESCITKRFKYPIFYKNCSKYGFIVSFLKGIRAIILSFYLNQKIFDKIICVSEFQRQKHILGKFSADRLITVNNPINSDFFLNHSSSKEDMVCFFGRFSKEKSVDLVVKAFSSLDEKFNNYKLVLIGEGPEKDNLEKLIEKYNIANFEILPFMKPFELKKIISKSKFTILPSVLYESFGLTIVESIFCNTIPIVSDLGALGDTASNSFGLKFRSGDCVDLKNKIEYGLINFEGLQEEMSLKIGSIHEKFSEKTYLENLKKVYFE